MKTKLMRANNSDDGYSVIELLAVMAIIMVLSGITLFYLLGHQKLYKPDDQSLVALDLLQEARQRSLTQIETMRVEINRSNNTMRLIDENGPGTADDDREIKKIKLFEPTEVRVGARPANIAVNPLEPLPVPTAVFKPSVYPTSISQDVCTLRFMSNGTVLDAGTNPTGGGSVATGSTIHIWAPKKATPGESDIARAITVIGSTGTIRLWEWNQSLTTTNKWKDSRRASTYGGGTGGNVNAP